MPEKPKIKDTFISTMGSYIPLYDIQEMDGLGGIEGKKIPIAKGRPIPPSALGPKQEIPMTDRDKMTVDWIVFRRDYDVRSDWDLLYSEVWIYDTGIIGHKILLVPKEKLLFKYNEPPTGSILVPRGQFPRMLRR